MSIGVTVVVEKSTGDVTCQGEKDKPHAARSIHSLAQEICAG
jgi:hypothetical protein